MGGVAGRNGEKIVFTSNRDGSNFEIYSMNPDGSAQTRLTNNTVTDSRPSVSPSGDKIAFTRSGSLNGSPTQEVLIMNADGSNVTQLTTEGDNASSSFSADGRKILFQSTRDGNAEIYSMDVDGTDQVRLTNNVAADSAPHSLGGFLSETVGVYRPTTGQWLLRQSNSAGLPSITINSFPGLPGDLAVTGDWNGDAITDIGFFRDGTWVMAVLGRSFLGFLTVEALPELTFGQFGDLPVAGDWNGDGIDDIGFFRPTAPGAFFLRRPVGASIVITTKFAFGTTGDLPVAGDWDGDGVETTGVFRPGAVGTYFLANNFANVADIAFNFGTNGDRPIAGDWPVKGTDRVGVFRPSTSTMFLGNNFANVAETVFTFGQAGDQPVAGNWP